ncbi:MAG: DUF6261 family protein, partial [Bacteroidales bacterium]|nr:DUF6261 family protein [Bacteroidales bacterium]
MKIISSLKNYRMPHGLHLQFFVAFITLVKKFEVLIPKLGVLFDMLQEYVEKEDTSYKVVRKSDISEQKAEKDRLRDDIVVAIKNMLKSFLFHFDERVRDAAKRVKIIFDNYNKPTPIIKLPYDAETIAINNFIQELENKYAADIQLLGLTDWINELTVRNAAFEQLTISYNEQLSEKTPLRPKETRQATDDAYKDIITVIEGTVVLEMKEKGLKDITESEYYPFISELNNLITHYNIQIARHIGRLLAEKEKEK